MAEKAKLKPRQIVVLKMLAKRGGYRPISLPHGLRGVANSLWRRDLVEVWYQQARGMEPALRGPFYALTMSGKALADIFLDHESRRLAGPQGLEKISDEPSTPKPDEQRARRSGDDFASRRVFRLRRKNGRGDDQASGGTQLHLLAD
jgi:hypothetical protein